jgi:hypothetical protein
MKRPIAILLALSCLGFAGIRALDSLARTHTSSTIACYVALANDITPVIDAAAPDVAAESPECVAQPEMVQGKNPETNVLSTTFPIRVHGPS